MICDRCLKQGSTSKTKVVKTQPTVVVPPGIPTTVRSLVCTVCNHKFNTLEQPEQTGMFQSRQHDAQPSDQSPFTRVQD